MRPEKAFFASTSWEKFCSKSPFRLRKKRKWF